MPELQAECFIATLFTAITRTGVLFLWPVRVPATGGRSNEWHTSMATAAQLAMPKWIRIKADMNLRAYQIFAAESSIPDPIWPELDFAALCRIALKDRLITSVDHPVSTYRLAMLLLYENWRLGGRPIVLSNVSALSEGLPARTKWRALGELERLGMVDLPAAHQAGTIMSQLWHTLWASFGPCCGAVMGQGWPEGPHSIFYSVFNSLMTNKRNQW